MGLWKTIVQDWKSATAHIDRPTIKRGAVLRVELTRFGVIGFDHYGVYAGNKMVIHFSGGKIRKQSLKKFIEGAGILNGNTVDVMAFDPKFIRSISLEDSYKRARACLGMTGYDVLDANCEHFALWCRTGRAFSGQAVGSKSDRFELVGAFGALNFPRMIGRLYNDLGMKKSRSVFINKL